MSFFGDHNMIIYAIYIIKSDGRPLLCECFQSSNEMPNEMLLSGLVTALKGFSHEVLKKDITSIVVENLIFHLRSFGYYTIVLVSDLESDPNSIMEEIGYRFIKSYGEIIQNKDIRIDKLLPFKEIIKEIFIEHSFDESKSINPTKILSTAEIFDLPNDLQSIALTMLSLGESTINELAHESEQDILLLEPKVKRLQKLGFVGQITRDDETFFFCNRFSNNSVLRNS